MDMKNGSKILVKIFTLLGLVALATGVGKLVNMVELHRWLQLLLVFLGTKILFDLGFAIFRKRKRYMYFEDYLRETGVYTLVSAICVAGILMISRYIGGVIWDPLPVAILVLIWR